MLTCAENWIAAGSNSGTVNSLDLRNGEFMCTWRPSEFPSAQVHVPCMCILHVDRVNLPYTVKYFYMCNAI